MSDINSKEFKRKYIKSKIKLRQWENEFIAENGRVPTKEDIRCSPSSVREHYKLYYTLKTRILEAQILGEDQANASISQLNRSRSDGVLKEYTNTIDGDRIRTEDDVHSDESAKEKYDPECDKTDEKTVWGAHLNRTKTINTVEKEKCSLLSEAIADRLFKGSSFKKRNPRKSLSFSKKKSNKSINSDDHRSFDFPDISSVMSPCSDYQNDGDQSLSESLFSVENDCSPNIKALITSSASLSPLLKKPEQRRDEKTANVLQPVSLIQVVASDPSVVLKTTRYLDVGWVKRCTQACDEVKEEGKSPDSGFDSLELSQILEENRKNESSDDDLIVGSDNEIGGGKLTCNFIKQKRKAEGSPIQKSTDGEESPSGWQASKRIKVDAPITEETTKPKIEEEMRKSVLEKKIQTGRLNENYVRINLKRKVFVRGKRNFNFARHKKKEWKNKKKDLNDGRESGGIVQCYRCGESGHFGRYCQKTAEDKLLEDDGNDNEELPTLEEAEKMAKEKVDENHLKRKNVLVVDQPEVEGAPLPKVDPLYSLREDGLHQKTSPEVYEALKKFGHDSFRPGQEEAIMRILSGQSTLLIVATGGGKTLCYQLPAYLYANRTKCIALVVSPLVSLMEDQVSGSSSFFKVGCLHNSQTQKQREAVIEDAKSGKLYALLMSPEAVVADDFFALGSVFRQLPPIAFACIDEVHCVSQWSHNFRPSYLMISKVLKEKLGVTTILGLTATATASSIASIARELGIDTESGIIRDVPLPKNLLLSVSREENKDEALIRLLQSPRFKDANAILVYCTRRDECERLAVYIRTRLQELGLREGRGARSLMWGAEAYHAGLAAGRRRQVQRAFMRGNLRIVVATVAFGMGINKRDIRGVVHYNMPRDLESYVQEVGRAGRDGEEAFCHLFLDAKGRDLFELRRHVYANAVDRHVLRRLLQRVFRECTCEGKGRRCVGHEVAFDCAETVQALDIPEENIYTLLSYLELNEKKFIKVLAPVYIKCKVKSYKGLKEVISASKRCPPLAYGCALRSQKEKSEILEFDVIEVANKLGWDSGAVKNQIKGVEWERRGAEGKWHRTGIAVEFSVLGFRVCSRGDMTPFELDEALDYLTRRVESQEKRSLTKLDLTFSTFDHFAKESYEHCLEDSDEVTSQELKKAVQRYFETEELRNDIRMRRMRTESFDEDAVAADVRALISIYRDNTFNGRAVARIFHGIQSPNYPASLWFRCKFWRKHMDKDFNKISRLATLEILKFKNLES